MSAFVSDLQRGMTVTVWRQDEPHPHFAVISDVWIDLRFAVGEMFSYSWADERGSGTASCCTDTRGAVWAPGWEGDEVGALLARRALVA